MTGQSKVIGKTDESAIALLHDIFGDKIDDVKHIDSYYNISGKYHFLEFIKCDKCRPFEYDTNDSWEEIKGRLQLLWDFTQRAHGYLYIVCYEDTKEQFQICVVESIDDTRMVSSNICQSFDEFKIWFQEFNEQALK